MQVLKYLNQKQIVPDLKAKGKFQTKIREHQIQSTN